HHFMATRIFEEVRSMSSRPLCLAGLPLLAACGGGGSIVLDLTDAPPDMSRIAHVYITGGAGEAHVVGTGSDENGDPKDASIDQDDKWRTVTSRAGTFDLVALQNDARAELGELDLLDGKVTQIRLVVDGTGKNTVELKDTHTSCPLDTKS